MYDIITFGGAVIDAFLYTGLPEKEKEMCYPIGEKIGVEKLHFSTGGGGTNTAVSFSRLGLKTGAIIKVGTDSNSEIILNELKKERVDFLGKQEKGLTDFSVILDSKEHDRTVLTYKEKSNNLSFNELNLSKLKTKWFYFSAADNTSLQAQKKLASYAVKNKIKIAYNPSSYLTKRGISYIKDIVKNVEILILNDDEAKDLVRDNLFQNLHNLGPKIVCITYGPKGNAVSDGKHLFVSRPRNIKIVERTGAGDAFASGFIFGMIKLNDVKKALACGSLNAESVIQIQGAKNGLLNWKEMSKELQSSKIRVTEKV